MTFISEFSQNMLYLAVWTVYLSFISCAEKNKDVQLTKLAYDDDDKWWRKIFTSTEEPDFWWKRFTSDPRDEIDSHQSKESFHNSLITVLVFSFFGFVLVCVGIFYCVQYVTKDWNRITVSSSLRLTARSTERNIHSSPENIRANMLQNESYAASAPAVFSITTDSSNINNATDKPPSYVDVVISDTTVAKFSKVIPQASESPPPKYDENFKY